jgi:hypothetical protein
LQPSDLAWTGVLQDLVASRRPGPFVLLLLPIDLVLCYQTRNTANNAAHTSAAATIRHTASPITAIAGCHYPLTNTRSDPSPFRRRPSGSLLLACIIARHAAVTLGHLSLQALSGFQHLSFEPDFPRQNDCSLYSSAFSVASSTSVLDKSNWYQTAFLFINSNPAQPPLPVPIRRTTPALIMQVSPSVATASANYQS